MKLLIFIQLFKPLTFKNGNQPPRSVEQKRFLKMALRKFKPVTAGTRWRIGNAYAEVTTNVPEKVCWNQREEPVVVIHLVT